MDGDDILFARRYSVQSSYPKKKKEERKNSREVKVEYVHLQGKRKRVFRLYERSSEHFGGVGWIVNDDIDECMICNREFYFFRRRHHCRSCGNLVCDDCSPHFVEVEEMKELGEVRVCVQCYWGQYPVYAARGRVYSDSDDDDEEDKEENNELNNAMMSSKINASINSSTRTVDVDVEDFMEYGGVVVLEAGLDWSQICSAIWTALEMPMHMNKMFEYFVIVDEDGDDISPNIADADSFWEHSHMLTPTSKNKLLACLEKEVKQALFKRRKQLLQEHQLSRQGSALEGTKEVPTEDMSHTNITATEATPHKEDFPVRHKPNKRSSISQSDEALINLSRQLSTDDTTFNETSSNNGLQEQSKEQKEDPLFANGNDQGIAIKDRADPIVGLNEKGKSVIVQLKSGREYRMSKADSESLILARKAIAESYQFPEVSSPAQLAVVVNKKQELEEKVTEIIENEKQKRDMEKPKDRNDSFDISDVRPLNIEPRLINSYQNELKKAFSELSILSRKDDESISESFISLSTFLQWEEVTRAISEIQSLNAGVIEEEFVTIAGFTNAMRNNSDKPVLSFEGFCLLMERLETLGERRSVSIDKSGDWQNRRISLSNVGLTDDLDEADDTDAVDVPEELVQAHTALSESSDANGVTFSSVLKWENLQEALSQNILKPSEIEELFNEVISDRKAHNDDACLSLKEFYSFAVRLQILVDKKCGGW